MTKINVIVKDPGYPPCRMCLPGSYRSLKRFIGSGFDIYSVGSDLVLICREKVAALNEPFNSNICGIDFYGTVIFLGWENEKFADCPVSFETFKQLFPRLFEENK